MHSQSERISPFDRVFDVVIVGSGHSGFASAMSLSRLGRSVLLIGPTADLVWESGRAFGPIAGRCDDPTWYQMCGSIAQRGGYNGEFLDGAMTEVVATDMLFRSSASVLYYARPVAVETEGEAIAGLILATKAGLKRVAGRQWIDATETGDLIRLATSRTAVRTANAATIHLYFQHADWKSLPQSPLLGETIWQTERVMTHAVSPADLNWRLQTLEALGTLESAVGESVAGVTMSHFSFEPLPAYLALTDAAAEESQCCASLGISNLVSASPVFCRRGIQTLADRFMLGIDAVTLLEKTAVHEAGHGFLKRPIGPVTPRSVVKTTVCVAGAGTGGVIAALAAAQAGAKVTCVEPMNFAGGIGVGGGIHFYYFGVPGGIQQEIDVQTRELMNRFGGGPLNDGPFNPWAKMIALQKNLVDANVTMMTRALLFGVESSNGRVVAALVATPDGVVRVEAQTYVDGTGDGDLAAMAGAQFTIGREHDGMPHAYSQSSGVLRRANDRPRMRTINYDAGFCDPTDPEDLTRARLVGIRQYLRQRYQSVAGVKEGNRPEVDGRPTYIAPAIGLRQARQISTEYILTLDDQIRARTFKDPIGYTGCHYDNHATDYEFESDEALFWVWGNRAWRSHFSGQMAYGMLVPQGVTNVWIGSRCVGVTQDAHHSTRMQRDMQRIGEAAGFAAALAAQMNVDAMALPYPALKHWLDQTGALDKQGVDSILEFGRSTQGDAVHEGESPQALTKALESLDRGAPGADIWRLYQCRSEVEAKVVQRLNSDRPMTSWLAACVMAMWNLGQAQGRLIKAIQTREFGYDDSFAAVDADGKPIPLPKENPTNNNRTVPNWLIAVALLRRIGTPACLDALESLVDSQRVLIINVGTTLALTLEQLVRRGLSPVDRSRVQAMLDKLLTKPVAGQLAVPQRMVGKLANEAQADAVLPQGDAPRFGETFGGNVVEDNLWQLHLAVAQARAALGLLMQDEAKVFARDPRGLVRGAFAKVAKFAKPAKV